jgi:hypothetical protein
MKTGPDEPAERMSRVSQETMEASQANNLLMSGGRLRLKELEHLAIVMVVTKREESR